MRRVLKFFAVGLLSLVGLAAAAVAAVILFVPRERVVTLATEQVRAATGRELTIAGEVTPSFWPVLGVHAAQVRLANAAWGDTPHMVSASAIEIGVELLPLLSGEIRVARLRLVEPVMALEIDAEGRRNWTLGDQVGAGPDTGGAENDGRARQLSRVALPEATIADGRLTFEDARTGQRLELAAIDLTANAEAFDAPLRLEGEGLWKGERARLEALVETPAKVLAGELAGVRIALAGPSTKVSFEGDLALPPEADLPQFEGRLSAEISRPVAMHVWVTDTPGPAALAELGALTVEGTISVSEPALELTATGSATYRGRAVGFDVSVKGTEGWDKQGTGELVLTARSEGLFDLSFQGPVSTGGPVTAEGPLKLAVSDLRGIVDWAGDGTLPAGIPATLDLAGVLAVRDGERIAFDGLKVMLGDTKMTGAAAVDVAGARPFLTARLESGPLDVSHFVAGQGDGESGDAATATATEGWSTEPIDATALRKVDADVAIRAEAVDLGDITLGQSDVTARLRDGQLNMMIERVEIYGGAVSGTVALAEGEALGLSANLAVTDVQLRPFLAATAGMDSLEGRGSLKLDIQGNGRSVEALMRSLSGSGALELANGTIHGVNLAALVRNLTGRGGEVLTTDFSSITGTFEIHDGVLRNSNLSLLGPLVRVIGAGMVDLGGRAQDFRLEPKAVASLVGQGGGVNEAGLTMFPVIVSGTWAEPRFRPDLGAAMRGLIMDPDGAIEGVTGLVESADPGQAAGAILGRALGSPSSGGVPGATGTASGDRTDELGLAPPTGGLIGALGGIADRVRGGGDASPPATNAVPAPEATKLAPAIAPAPLPAGPYRAELAAPAPESSAAPLSIEQEGTSPASENVEKPALPSIEDGVRTLKQIFQ